MVLGEEWCFALTQELSCLLRLSAFSHSAMGAGIRFSEFRRPYLPAIRGFSPIPIAVARENSSHGGPHQLGVFVDVKHPGRLQLGVLEVLQEVPGGNDHS